MGDVWVARASGPAGFAKRVALKTIRPSAATPDAAMQMFSREARVAALLAHPNCVQVFELGEEDGTYFIAMEYLDGFSLGRTVQRAATLRRAIPIEVVARIIMDAATGLHYAHTLVDDTGAPLHIVHRDISLENILVTFGGQTKIVDFGIAKAASSLAGEGTQTGQLKGKYAYMAPEYLRHEPIDARIDLFALGVVAYRALTGKKPFSGDTDAQVIAAILQATPERAKKHRPEIPDLLDTVIAKALAKDPKERWQSAQALRSAVAQAVPNVADVEAVAAYLEALWPADNADRVAVRELAAGKTRDSQPILVADERDWISTLDLGALAAKPTTVQTAPPRRWRWWIALGVPLLVVALVAAGILIARRKTEPSRPAAIAPSSAHYKSGNGVVLLLEDLPNTSGAQELGDGAIELTLTRALGDSPQIRLFTRAAALEAAGAPHDHVLDDATAKLAAQRKAIAVIVRGAIEKTNHAYKIRIEMYDAATGKTLASGAATGATPDAALAEVPVLAAKLRIALGDTKNEQALVTAMRAATPRTAVAAHELSLANEASKQGDLKLARAHAESALAQDPDLGLAHVAIAIAAYNSSDHQSAQDIFRRAMSHVGHMTDHERRKLMSTYYAIIGNVDKAIEEMTATVDTYPFDEATISNLAVSYSYKRDWTKALAMSQRAVELAGPGAAPPIGNHAVFLLYSGDVAGAIETARVGFEKFPAFERFAAVRAMAELVLGKPDEARRDWSAMKNNAGESGRGLADLALYEGKLADAQQILVPAIAADKAARNVSGMALGLAMLAEAQLLAGKASAARRTLETAAAASKEVAIQFHVARLYTVLGDEKAVIAIQRKLASDIGLEPRLTAAMLAAELELHRKHAQAAVLRFEEAKTLLDTWYVHYGLLRAYLAAGAYPEAFSESEICLRRRGEAAAIFVDESPTYRMMAPVYYYRGRALEGMRSPAAVDAYKQFLDIKSKGSDPLVADARKRLAAIR